jgi:hypothetical protein
MFVFNSGKATSASRALLESPKTSNEPSPTSKRPKGYKKRNVLSSSFSAVALTDLCEDVDADLLQTARRVPITICGSDKISPFRQ